MQRAQSAEVIQATDVTRNLGELWGPEVLSRRHLLRLSVACKNCKISCVGVDVLTLQLGIVATNLQ